MCKKPAAVLGSAQLQNFLQVMFPVRVSHAAKDAGEMSLLSVKRVLCSHRWWP